MDRSVNLPSLDVPGLLHRNGLRPDKSLGQNFLVDESSLYQVVEAARISSLDVVLEIGAGLGSLTRHLAQVSQTVVAVELDHRLISLLFQVVGHYPNVQVVEGDILAFDPARLVPKAEYIVVANIPYYITSPLIRHLLEARIAPKRVVLTIQREVAARICAMPGDLSILALSVQVYGHPQILAHIPAAAFYPPPKVDSSIICIDMFPCPLIPAAELDVFFQLIKAGFSQKRKTLRNALSAGLHIPPARVQAILVASSIDPMRRAETLDISEWYRLTTLYINSTQNEY